jgi:PKD repeat protein
MKNKVLQGLLIFGLIMGFSSCEKDDEKDPNAPEACFTVSGNMFATGTTEFSSDCSVNATGYAWDFGDGATSTDANPDHSYTEAGKFTVELTVTSEAGDTDATTMEITIEAPDVYEHRGDITQDETWVAGVHLITGDVSVENASLTIEPGAIVRFTQGTALYVAYGSSNNGKLVANGVEDNGILFTSASASPSNGDWEFIWFDDGASSASAMTYCTFEYGGGYSDSYGMVHLKDAEVTFNNCTFRHSASKGITLNANAGFQSFDNNAVKNNDLNPISIYASHAHTIGTGNDIESSTGILVSGNDVDHAEVTWKKQSVPYLISNDVYVQSSTGAILNIEAGTTIAFSGNAAMYVGYSSGTFGTLKCVGTVNEPITFTSGSASKSEGDWEFLWFDSGTSSNTILEYCIVEYGGGYSDNYGMIHLEECEITIRNSTITNSQSFGISADTEAGFESFSNNTVKDNERNALSIYANYVHTIGEENSITSDLGIRVRGDDITTSNPVWYPQDTYYLIASDIEVGSESGTDLTIGPGTELRFANSAALYVGYRSNKFGNLIADGTASDPIIFTSASPVGSQSPGDWDFIWFDEGIGSSTIMNYCEVSYGGGYNKNYGTIHCTDTGTDKPLISNTTVSYSDSYGVSANNGSSPLLTNMSYSNNLQANEDLN